MTPEILDKVFEPLRGIPCWNVRQGHGSFLTFEFGAPRQEIGQVIQRRSDDPSSYSRRLVTIRGEWHLWIYCSGWRITQDGNIIVCNESTRESIQTDCNILHGQAFADFKFNPKSGSSSFSFDLGGRVHTGPYSKDLLEQWFLYCPDGQVLTYRSDGAFSYGPSVGNQKRVFAVPDIGED